MVKSTIHISLGQVLSIEAAGNLLTELQALLKPLPDLGIEYQPPIPAEAIDSILTITANEAELPRLEKLARTYLRL
ncbi:hypothetical protein [Deinococcus sp. UYEF24]